MKHGLKQTPHNFSFHNCEAPFVYIQYYTVHIILHKGSYQIIASKPTKMILMKYLLSCC